MTEAYESLARGKKKHLLPEGKKGREESEAELSIERKGWQVRKYRGKRRELTSLKKNVKEK